MFAPKVATTQTKGDASSTGRFGQRTSRRAGNERNGDLEGEIVGENLNDLAAPRRLAWDFSKIPLFPRNGPKGRQAEPPFAALPVTGETIQMKLAVGSVADPLEHEADRIADQVLAAPANPTVSGVSSHIQRLTAQPSAPANVAPASVGQVLTAPGRPLEPALRQDMEQRFGYDFSRVRVHAGGRAAEQSARDLNANAYTVGSDIVFGAGQFLPGTHQGRRLIAHELTHVVQQSSANESCVGQSSVKRGLSPISHGGVALRRQPDAGVPPGAPGPSPVPAPTPTPAPAQPAPTATIGAITFRGASNRIAPTRTATAQVTITGLPAGGSATIDVQGSGGANGTAAITTGATMTGSGAVTVRGDAQTTPGNAGNLMLRATVGGTVVGRSPGFTVAAWPADFTISKNSEINTTLAVGLRVNIACISDGSGALAELSEAEHTERVDIGSRDNPPFTKPGAISATGTGTSSFMAATSSSLVDSHAYARANIDTSTVAPGSYTLVYRQNFLFNDRRTGTTNAVVQNSGFTITHRVLVLDLPVVGRFSSHATVKSGAAVSVEGKAATAGSGSAMSDTHTL